MGPGGSVTTVHSVVRDIELCIMDIAFQPGLSNSHEGH